MKEHSEIAWKIASLYSNVLASETRDLAAHIDVALLAERERCAQIAEKWDGLDNVAAQIRASQQDTKAR